MKKIVLILTVALLGSIVTNAQQHRRPDMTPEQMVEKRVERLDKALALTAEQKTEITKIFVEEMQSTRAERAKRQVDGTGEDAAARQARHQQMQAQREATDAKVVSVLTDEQAAKYAEIKQRGRDRGQEIRCVFEILPALILLLSGAAVIFHYCSSDPLSPSGSSGSYSPSISSSASA